MLLSWTSAGENRVPAGGDFMLADLNGDGRLDIVQTERPLPGPPAGDQDLGVFLQDAQGQFRKQPLVPIYTSLTLHILVVDVNEDGKPDLLAEDVGNDLVVALGAGDGTFQEARWLGLSAGYYPALADLNGDAHLDIVAGDANHGGVTVHLGQGNGTFAFGVGLEAAVALKGPELGGGHGAGAVLVGDVNADGRMDVLVATPENASTKMGRLLAFVGNGDGTFREPVVTADVAAWRGCAADFNRDGFLDYAGDRQNPGALEVWLGSGDGTFTRKANYSLSDIWPVTVDALDVNGDGIPDLAVSGERLDNRLKTPLSIYLGKGDGTFRSRVRYTGALGAVPMNVPPRVADLNGDGRPDLLTHGWGELEAGITVGFAQGFPRTGGEGFQLDVELETSGPVVLEVSSDLINWSTLATNATARGAWSVVDDSPTGPAQRFYRAKSP